jgi:hypothetical protein
MNYQLYLNEASNPPGFWLLVLESTADFFRLPDKNLKYVNHINLKNNCITVLTNKGDTFDQESFKDFIVMSNHSDKKRNETLY